MAAFIRKVNSILLSRLVLLFNFSQRVLLRRLINCAYHKGFLEFSKGIKLIKLTKAQNNEIKNYYKRTAGVKVNTKWHRLFYTLTGDFSPKYIPEELFLMKIMPSLVKGYFIKSYDDKNMYNRLFPDIVQPETILKKSHGLYYLNDSNAIKETVAFEKCNNISNAIIKPAIGTNSGINIEILNIINGNTNIDGLKINELFYKYGDDFLIQRVIHQHSELEKLNPSSVNTMRIMTYRRFDETIILGSVIRIGKLNSNVDNFHHGGIICGINDSGQLNKVGYTNVGGLKKVYITPTDIVLENFQIPYYDKVLETAKKAHLLLPQIPLIGWDFTLNNNNEVVLIEFNAPYDPNLQICFGPAFGKYTDEILGKVKSHKYSFKFNIDRLYDYN